MYFPMSYKVFHSLDSSVNISTSIVWVWLIEVLEDVVLGHQVLAAAGVAGDVPPPGHAHGSVGGGPGLTIIVDQLWPIEPGLVSWTVVLIIYWLILYLCFTWLDNIENSPVVNERVDVGGDHDAVIINLLPQLWQSVEQESGGSVT